MSNDAPGDGMEKPPPPPEAALIRLTRQAAHIKTPAASRAAGMSTARWSQIENGYETRQGRYKPVSAPAVTIAHMAHAVSLEPGRLESARPDAAAILREILRRQASAPDPEPPPDAGPSPLTPQEQRDVAAFVQAIRTAAALVPDDDGDRAANGT